MWNEATVIEKHYRRIQFKNSFFKAGSGKTSSFKTIKKWYNNYSGSIFINNQNISTMDNADISRTISYLNEDVSLFSCSVRNNISLHRKYASKAFDTTINQTHLELDLDSEIVDEGHNISSGERELKLHEVCLNLYPD